ncbi:MAG: hypothetical protein JXJ04_22460 [Spirochaetales bacterium]|nr:hypothetical protein [Spirochaetales bacterium]
MTAQLRLFLARCIQFAPCFFILPALSLLTLTWVYFVISIVLYIGVIIFIKKEEKQPKETFGILAVVSYIASDIICSFSYQGYISADQAISELSAIGAPTASLWKTLTILFSPLVIAFGTGVFMMSGKKISLRIMCNLEEFLFIVYL